MTPEEEKTKKATAYATFALSIVLALISAAALFAITIWLRVWWRAITDQTLSNSWNLEQIGQLGDSVAPLTALFALVAALGAWLSYRTQLAQLNHERAASLRERLRNQQSSFDELFFRLIADYEVNRDALGYVIPMPSHPMNFSGKDVIHGFQAEVQAGQNKNPSNPVSACEIIARKISQRAEAPLKNLSEQVLVLIEWLHTSSVELPRESIRGHGKMIAARLTDSELWFWQIFVAMSLRSDLIKFMQDLMLYAEGGGPKNVFAGRGMTAEEAMNDVNAWLQSNRNPAQ